MQSPSLPNHIIMAMSLQPYYASQTITTCLPKHISCRAEPGKAYWNKPTFCLPKDIGITIFQSALTDIAKKLKM